jgi:hypothetical protein
MSGGSEKGSGESGVLLGIEACGGRVREASGVSCVETSGRDGCCCCLLCWLWKMVGEISDAELEVEVKRSAT